MSCPRRPIGSFAPALIALAVALGASLGIAARASAVDLVLSEMTYVGSEAGRPGMVLEAERARIEYGGDLAHLEGVRLDAADDDGGASLWLTCDRALLNLTTSDFTAEGNVRGHTADGHEFKTEAAAFHHRGRVIDGDAPVDILDPAGTRLKGTGFRYDIRLRSMKMQRATVSEEAEPFE